MTRRELFSSLLKKADGAKAVPPFMPYLNDVSLLKTLCPSCEAPCVGSCDEGIIVLDKGIATLDFSKGGCTFCEKCAQACDKGVLKADKGRKIDISIAIRTKDCLAWKGTMCYSCKDACDMRAISFLGIFRPSIDHELCNGCGACLSPCPTDAIYIKPAKEIL